jgi:hypothetical protein
VSRGDGHGASARPNSESCGRAPESGSSPGETHSELVNGCADTRWPSSVHDRESHDTATGRDFFHLHRVDVAGGPDARSRLPNWAASLVDIRQAGLDPNVRQQNIHQEGRLRRWRSRPQSLSVTRTLAPRLRSAMTYFSGYARPAPSRDPHLGLADSCKYPPAMTIGPRVIPRVVFSPSLARHPLATTRYLRPLHSFASSLAHPHYDLARPHRLCFAPFPRRHVVHSRQR